MKPVFWAFSIYQYEQQATVRPDLPTAPYIIPKMSFIAISNFSLKGESLEEIFDEGAGDSKSLLKVKSYNHFSLNHQTYGTVQVNDQFSCLKLSLVDVWVRRHENSNSILPCADARLRLQSNAAHLSLFLNWHRHICIFLPLAAVGPSIRPWPSWIWPHRLGYKRLCYRVGQQQPRLPICRLAAADTL